MAAHKAPTITRLVWDNDKQTVFYSYYLNPTGSDEVTASLANADRSTLLAIGKFSGAFHGHGTPIGMTKDEHIMHITNKAMQGIQSGAQYVAKPVTPTTNPTRKAEPMSTIDDAVKQLMETMLASGAMTPPSSQIDPMQIETLQVQIDELRNALASRPAPVQIVVNGVASKPTVGVVHAMYAKIAKVIGKRHHVYLVGPAGTGKSTIPQQIADQMGLEFSAVSCGTTDAKFDYVGYRDGHGVLHSTSFRERYEFGGVMLLDEMDNASPDVLVTLNQALSNGQMAYPDKMVTMHPDFICIGAGNTYGSGATAQYVGRSPIDGATLNRFVKIVVDIDTNIEDAMVASTGLDALVASQWLTAIRQARANCQTNGLRVMVTPRDAKHGASLLQSGFDMSEAVDMTFGFGLDGVQRDKVMSGVTLY